MTEDRISKFRHDLKNSLTVIRLNLEFLKKDPKNLDNIVKKIGDRLDKILEDLKSLNSV